MNAQDLELKIAGLEKAIKEHKDFTGTYENDLKQTQKQLEDYNKPELSPVVMDQINSVVESVLNGFGWDDSDNYQDLEYEIDYDGRVSLSNISFDTYEIQERIVDQVCNLFKEADCPDELDTTEVDNHKPVE